MEKIYRKIDITNVEAAEVMRRFGAYGGDAVIEAEGERVFIYIPEE